MVCGSSEVDIEQLRKNTEYSSCSATDTTVQRFWAVLESFSHGRGKCARVVGGKDFSKHGSFSAPPDDRRRFLGFVWGRTRLPPRGAPWPQKFTLNVGGADDIRCPTAATCVRQRREGSVSHTCSSSPSALSFVHVHLSHESLSSSSLLPPSHSASRCRATPLRRSCGRSCFTPCTMHGERCGFPCGSRLGRVLIHPPLLSPVRSTPISQPVQP
jgi:hypothetical protein